MHFLDFVLRNLLRRKVRTALTIVGVSVAIAAVVGLLSITNGYEQSSKEVYASHGTDMVVVRAGVAVNATSTLEESLGKRLQGLDGVSKVTMPLHDSVSFEGITVPVPLNGWPLDSFDFDSLNILPPGRTLETSDKQGVLLGITLANSLGKKVGDEVEIEGDKFRVVGIYESGSIIEDRSAVISLRNLQNLMGRDALVSQFEITLRKDLPDRAGTIAALRQQIENLKDEDGNKLGLAAQPSDDFVKSDNQIRLAHAMAWVTSAIALIVGSIGMLNTMIVSVLERTQEIGILRAIGWRKGRIVRMIMWESFTLSFAGAAIGILLAYVMIQMLGWFPAAQGAVHTGITRYTVFMAYVLSILVGLVGGGYPALRGAGLPPTEALRYE
ncbi:MAG TPA: ABC transporter permease [Pirellulales bacterium]|nr:ABC transporter permease [Pirellulales bacterium]